DRDLAGRLRRIRLLREQVRLLQQDLGLTRGSGGDADLALAERSRAAARRRNQRRSRTKPRATPRRTGRAGTADAGKGVAGPLPPAPPTPPAHRPGIAKPRSSPLVWLLGSGASSGGLNMPSSL